MGLASVPGGISSCAAAAGEECRALSFTGQAGKRRFWPCHFLRENRKGDVWSMTVLGKSFAGLEYCFEIDGKPFSDPYGRCFTESPVWGEIWKMPGCSVDARWKLKTLTGRMTGFWKSLMRIVSFTGFTAGDLRSILLKGERQGDISRNTGEKSPILKSWGLQRWSSCR